MKILKKNDKAHLEAMSKIQELMKKPEAMKDWFEKKKKEFETLAEDNYILVKN